MASARVEKYCLNLMGLPNIGLIDRYNVLKLFT